MAVRRTAVLGLAFAAALAGCTAPQQAGAPASADHAMALHPVGFDRLPGWPQDRLAEALPAFRASCAAYAARPEADLGGQQDTARLGGSARLWLPACAAAARIPAGDEAAARSFFQSWFVPYALSDPDAPRGLFTGYYEPEVRGARSPGQGYDVPLLARPADLVQAELGQFSADLAGRSVIGRVEAGRLLPYYDRAAIVGGALDHRRLGLLWLADPIDAFFLQIQGSGRVRLPDGHVVRVTYAGQNGRPYVPVGRVLADQGALPRNGITMQSIRAWLQDHPAQAASVMDANPSYVFFRELPDTPPDQGPPGALGVPLSPLRSAAIDRSFLPLGAPVWVDTTDALDGTPIRRLVMGQDLGGAIRGPVRADLFFGWTPQAEAHAGAMQQPGSAYVLLPRAAAAN